MESVHRNWLDDAMRDVDMRNAIDTPEKCQDLIDRAETTIEHDQLGAGYDLLVARRDHLLRGQPARLAALASRVPSDMAARHSPALSGYSEPEHSRALGRIMADLGVM